MGGKDEFGVAVALGMKLCFDTLNAAGGVNGRRIVQRIVDDEGKGPAAEANARKLVADGAFVLFGSIGGAPSSSISKVASELGVPFIGQLAGTPALRRPHQPMVFPVRAEHRDEFRTMMNWGRSTGLASLGFLFTDSDVGRQHLENVRLIAADLGLVLVQPVAVKPDATDAQIDAIVKEMVEKKPAMFLHNGPAKVFQKVVERTHGAGLRTTFIGVNQASYQIAKALGPLAQGIVFTQGRAEPVGAQARTHPRVPGRSAAGRPEGRVQLRWPGRLHDGQGAGDGAARGRSRPEPRRAGAHARKRQPRPRRRAHALRPRRPRGLALRRPVDGGAQRALHPLTTTPRRRDDPTPRPARAEGKIVRHPAGARAMKLIESILADAAAIAAVRRDIHAHPELCFEERRTADVIAQQLTDWGIPIHRGLGTTGVVAILKNGTSDRAVGLRADIDALPMTEKNTFAHASKHPGKMHACGHDGHTAMLLAAAKHLSKHRHYDGTVYLIFQPAEEGGGGAREMIKGRHLRQVPDGGGVRRAQLAGHGGRAVRGEARALLRVEQRVQDHDPRQGFARGAAAQRRRPGADRLPDGGRPSRPSSRATSGRSTLA